MSKIVNTVYENQDIDLIKEPEEKYTFKNCVFSNCTINLNVLDAAFSECQFHGMVTIQNNGGQIVIIGCVASSVSLDGLTIKAPFVAINKTTIDATGTIEIAAASELEVLTSAITAATIKIDCIGEVNIVNSTIPGYGPEEKSTLTF